MSTAMFYYQTFVNDISYKGNSPLVYSYEQNLSVGTVVVVPLKNKSVMAFISGVSVAPKFKTKQIEKVLQLPPLPITMVELALWIQSYYPAPIGVIAQNFIPRSLLNVHQLPIYSSSAYKIKAVLPKLTNEQKSVLKQVTNSNTYILHGETGSGKTRVYIELAQKTLSAGRSVIVLTPEIGLTPQLTSEFQNTFGHANVVLTHSRLTDKKRLDVWNKAINTTHPIVVIGPRSALFIPIKDVGLIVIDESHESSYKQDQSPHYHASKVAAQLAKLHNATLILGSATPSITDYFLAQTMKKPVLRMAEIAQVNTYSPPSIGIVDLKERSHFSKSRYLSNELIEAMGKALKLQEQTLLFLNRRGTARIVLCEQCSWQAICPRCNLPLTYHGDAYRLRCHTCGYSESATNCCPNCKNPNIILKSVGTKAIVDEVSKLFPQAQTQRFDTDNKKLERIEQHYDNIKSGKVDILVGTQVLVKGFDLPKLSVVGVVIADTSLSFPDYSSQERTYQLLRQVIGRVGRGHRNSTVVVQTYEPNNFVINAAVRGRWDKFYEYELQERKKFVFPPYCFLLKLVCRRSSVKGAQNASEKLANELRQGSLRILIEGPAPSFYEKVGNKYQWQIVIKSKQRDELIKVINILPSGWVYDIDPINLL